MKRATPLLPAAGRRNAATATAVMAVCVLCPGLAAADPMKPLGAHNLPAAKPLPAEVARSAQWSQRAASGVAPAGRPGTPANQGLPSNSNLPTNQVGDLTLAAIRQDGDGRWSALIGERWVGVGERLEAGTISAIETNRVVLTEGKSRTKVVHLMPPLEYARPASEVASAPSEAKPPKRPARKPATGRGTSEKSQP